MQPSLGDEELDAVAGVFRDGWPGAGPRVQAFRQEFAAYVGVPEEQLIAITSCTEGLFLTLEALDLGPNDEVVLPTISYVGAAHAVRSAGARIRLADVDPLTLNPTPEQIERCLNARTRALILLHYGGRPGWVEEIAALARRHGVLLIEDAACGLAATTPAGACGTLGDVGIWSFDSMKLLAAGDGGMLRCADEMLRGRIDRSSRLGGILSGLDAAAHAQRWWQMDPQQPGRRAFMNDLTAAIARVQLKRLPLLVERRAALIESYAAGFAGFDEIATAPDLVATDAPYFFWIQTPARDSVAWALRDRGVYATFRYWPLHRMRLYEDGGDYPGADLATRLTLLLPLHAELGEADVELICNVAIEASRGGADQ
ncbi:MAG TPA: aminotransferase class V-fold PLP-dependent enzyme [Allosphingosinicella sp.]